MIGEHMKKRIRSSNGTDYDAIFVLKEYENLKSLLIRVESKIDMLQCTYPGVEIEKEIVHIRAFIWEGLGKKVEIHSNGLGVNWTKDENDNI